MILQFKARNILSIREEQTLDFTASADKTFEEYAVVKIKNVRISKLGVIYGANASGKSNILKALIWLKDFVASEHPRKLSSGTGLVPFMLDADSREKHSALSIIFYVGDVRYEYAVELDKARVYHEECYFYPKSRRALFFNRTWNESKGLSELTFGPSLKLTSTQRLFIESNCIANASVLSTYINSNAGKIEEFETLKSFFTDRILPRLDPGMNLELFANEVVKKEKEASRFICDMLMKADFNITDLRVKEERGQLPQEALERLKKVATIVGVPEPDGSVVRDEVTFTHKTPFYTGELSDEVESEGTRRMYGLAALFYILIRDGQILVCDELENSLHYDLLTHIVKTFLVNSNRSQLIFATHSLLLLDEEFIRRDMVYFTGKDEAGATEIYRAKDFRLHKDVSILNAYRAGKLGAKPEMGSIFIN